MSGSEVPYIRRTLADRPANVAAAALWKEKLSARYLSTPRLPSRPLTHARHTDTRLPGARFALTNTGTTGSFNIPLRTARAVAAPVDEISSGQHLEQFDPLVTPTSCLLACFSPPSAVSSVLSRGPLHLDRLPILWFVSAKKKAEETLLDD